MKLDVRPATAQEVAFAWPFYRDYILEHIFAKAASAKSQDSWIVDEETRFNGSWSKNDPYIIELDGTPIGWLSISKANNTLTVQNVFIESSWQAKGIAERIFREMIPTWKVEKRAVVVPVFSDAPRTDQLENKLKELGFADGGNDGLVRLMTANWS